MFLDMVFHTWAKCDRAPGTSGLPNKISASQEKLRDPANIRPVPVLKEASETDAWSVKEAERASLGRPFSDSACSALSGQLSGVLVIAITFVSSRNAGWTDSWLRKSIQMPQTCYLLFTDCNL